MIKYAHVYALLLMPGFCTSCWQNQADLPKEKTRFQTKDASTSGWVYTKYEYTDSTGQRLIIQNSFPKSEQKHWRQWRDIQLCCIFRPDNQWKRSSSGIVSADWSYREKTITCTLIKKPTSVAGQNAIIHISPTPLVSGIVWQRGKLQPVNINLSGNFNKIIWEN